MILSVVICTYNRAELLERALNSLLNSPREASESWELLVIDNNSTDMTKEVVSSYEARYILEPNQGIAYARNRGYMEAKGTYVAYIDDDAYVDSGWLETLLKIIRTMKPDVIGGPIFPYYLHEKPEWFKDDWEVRTWGNESRFLDPGEVLSGSNMVFRHDLLDHLDGFKTSFGLPNKKKFFGEDTHLFKVLWDMCPKSQIFYSPEFYVYHLVSKKKMTVGGQIVRRFHLGNSYMRSLQAPWYHRIGAAIYFIGMWPITGISFFKYQFIQQWAVECIGKQIFYLGIVLGNRK